MIEAATEQAGTSISPTAGTSEAGASPRPRLHAGPAFVQDGRGWRAVDLTPEILREIDAQCFRYQSVSGRGILAVCGTYDVWQP